VNGVFFEEQTVESVAAAMETFAGMDFDRKKVMESAMKFSEAEFARKLEKIVQENLKI
jgi:hypothetical protein